MIQQCIEKHVQYVKYISRHKRHVFTEGRKIGVSLWRLLKHDWTKFLPSEWTPYANFFYRPSGVAQVATAAEQRLRQGEEQRKAFDKAWKLHQARNSHHWQYHVMIDGMAFHRLADDNSCICLQGNHPRWVRATDLLLRDDGSNQCLACGGMVPAGALFGMPIPAADRLEMVADWRGAGAAVGNPDTLAWYKKNRDNMIMHEDTRVWVEIWLGRL